MHREFVLVVKAHVAKVTRPLSKVSFYFVCTNQFLAVEFLVAHSAFVNQCATHHTMTGKEFLLGCDETAGRAL